MKKTNKSAKTALALSLAFICAGHPAAYAGIPVVDGLNLGQNVVTAYESAAQTLKQIEQYSQQVMAYKTQLDQYENMIKNTVAPAAYIWDQANAVINKLVAAQDMLNYYKNQSGSLDAYLNKYQTASYYRDSPCFQKTGCTAAEQKKLTDNRVQGIDAQKAANDAMFKGIEQQQDNLQADARQLERLQAAASTADGQVKAIQYANQLASSQGNQLLQIRGLMIAQQTAMAAKQAADTDKEAVIAAGDEAMMSGEFKKSSNKGY